MAGSLLYISQCVVQNKNCPYLSSKRVSIQCTTYWQHVNMSQKKMGNQDSGTWTSSKFMTKRNGKSRAILTNNDNKKIPLRYPVSRNIYGNQGKTSEKTIDLINDFNVQFKNTTLRIQIGYKMLPHLDFQ